MASVDDGSRDCVGVDRTCVVAAYCVDCDHVSLSDDSGACKCTIPVQKGNTSSNNVGLVAHRDQMHDADWSVGSNHVVVVGTLSDREIHSPVHHSGYCWWCLLFSLQILHQVGVRVVVVVVVLSASLPTLLHSNGYERSHHHCHGPYHRLA